MQENKETRNVRKQIRRICRKGTFDHKRIVLFGCVPGAKILRDELKRYHYSLSAIIDNNESKAGQECIGVTVYTPEAYMGEFQDDVAVLIWSNYWREMSKQLEEMGYKKNIHIFVFAGVPSRTGNDSLWMFFLNMIRIVKGYRIYNKFRTGNGRNRWVFVCPYPGTGDVYVAGGYFQEYIKREKINDYTILVLNKACAKVASLYQMKNIQIINQKEKNHLMRAYDFLGPEKMHMKPLLYWGWRTKKCIIQRYCENINFDDMFKYDVYGMNIEDSRHKPIFTVNRKAVDDFFYEHNLVKGKTVIMAPYAGSFVSDIPRTFWTKLAEELKNRGYSVCTNSAGSNEPVVKGTEPIFFDLTQTVPILDAAGYFIALRSGLCDIASSSSCKKIILYENGFNSSQYIFFSLRLMGLTDNVTEIIYECESDDDFLNTILKYFI